MPSSKILGVRLVEVVPRPFRHLRLPDLAGAGCAELLGDRQHVSVPGFLLHRVDERREEHVDLVELARHVLVEQQLDRTDEAVEMRPVAELHRVRYHVGAQAAEKAEPLPPIAQ